MKRTIFATFMLFAFSVFALAQSTTGRLLGNVSGPDGLLPGATITATDNQTGRSETTTSNDSGAYKFERIAFGSYTVKISVNGFKTYVATNVKIDANKDYTLSPSLEIGDVNVEVQVTAGADLINATDGALSSTVDSKQILDLPINGRNPLALLNLQAGVNATSNSINGQRSSSVNYTRDGINVQDNFIRTGGFVQDRPTVDDTGEFNVTTQNAGAELGNGGSTQVQLITPRGGNDFHGAAYIYNRNNYFAANTFGNNATKVDRPFLNRNQIGGKVSGPLPIPGFGEGTPAFFKDHGFFFVNYERFILRQQSPKTTTTLLGAARNGTFSYVDNGGVARTVNVLTGAGLLAPIPAANGGVLTVDPTIQARILDRAPTAGNTGSLLNNGLNQRFTFNQANNDTRDSLTTRFDVEINDSNSIYFVYKYNKNADDRTDIDGTFNVTPVNTQGGPTQSYLGSYTAVIGSHFTNEVRLGYNTSDPFFNEDPNFPTDFIIGGVPLMTNPQSSFQAQGRNTDQVTIQNNSSYSLGNHTMRFGIDFNTQRIASETNFNRVGIYNITTAANVNTPGLDSSLFPGGINATSRGFADSLRFLLGGVVGSGTIAAPFVSADVGPKLGASSRQRFRYETYGLYFGDSWRATPELTLNLGMRWDFFSPLTNPDVVYLEPDLEGATDFDSARTALLDSTGQYVLLGNNAGKAGRFFKPDYNNFGPVASFAYSPRDKGSIVKAIFGNSGVIRGGFRIGYINDEYVRSSDNAAGANAGLDLTGIALQNGSPFLNARFNNLPGFTLPTFQQPPISFATGNANAGNFFNTIFTIDPGLQMQRNMQYNVGFSREIGFDTAIEFRYVGGRSNNLTRGIDLNQINLNNANYLTDFNIARNNCRIALAQTGQFLDSRRCSSSEMLGTGLAGQVALNSATSAVGGFLPLAGFIRDRIQQGLAGELALTYITNGFEGFNGSSFRNNQNAGVVDILSASGKYRYNAFQFEVRKRFTDGLAFQANYSFSKTLANILTDGQTRFDPLLDNAQPELEYARADYDRTHTVNINANYELPFGKGKAFLNNNRIVDKIFGGWQLTSIINISSGTPISIKDINGTLNRTGRSNRQTALTNLTADQIKALTGIFFQPDGTIYFINPSVIGSNGSATNGNVESAPNANFPGQVFFRNQPGQTSGVGRNIIDGPWYYNVDAGIIKNIKFGERYNIQLRGEAFNVFNKTNFFIGENSGIFDIDGTTFGLVTPGSTYSPRIMQFAFRFEF